MVRRKRLGSELRRHREAAKKSIEDAAARLECSISKISRMETGKVPMRARDVGDLLELYGVTDGHVREELADMARETLAKGWWHSFNDVLPQRLDTYLGLENDAARLHRYDTQLVPGFLQNEGYARAVIRASYPNAPEMDIDRRVAARMARQSILTRESPPEIWVVLDEAVIRRPVGDNETMAVQLNRLVDVSKQPGTMVLVLPFSVGAHPSMGTSFSILGFPDDADPDVVYLEQITSSLYAEKPGDVAAYRLVFQHLCAMALDPVASRALITRVAREFA